MSATYTLHLPAEAVAGDPRALERSELVRDGFSWPAFLVPPLWLFWHRHWLMGLLAIVAVGGLAGILLLLGARAGTVFAAEFLLHGLFGLEGASLRRFAYARRRRPVSDVVVASDMAEAETKSFARYLAPADRPLPAPAGPRAPATVPPPRPGQEPVLGLFPDREGWR